jgi:2,3-bisphosphoglycerate-dependent phosphoglycerate mutase
MMIYLVRHGESIANVDKSVHKELPDHAIGLSKRGMRQASAAGKAIDDHLVARGNALRIEDWRPRVRLWSSPYKRTRQTADRIENRFSSPVVDRREHVLLCEQQFGLFDGLSDEELKLAFPHEHAFYAKCEAYEGRFWARMPLGESRFDVACRVHQAFGTFHRDAEKHNIHNIVVVCHGVTLRAFVMMWFHEGPEWFDAEPNPLNASVRLIEDGYDCGYIFEGFKPGEG